MYHHCSSPNVCVFYFPLIGIPSAAGANYTEYKANRWAARYFEDPDKGFGVKPSNFDTSLYNRVKYQNFGWAIDGVYEYFK